jgi:hypothetical protein
MKRGTHQTRSPQNPARLKWIEGRLTDGSQLVLPKGCTFTVAGGRTWSSKKELAFTWMPEDPNVPVVTHLASAGERHLITSSGTSSLGIDSEKGVAAKVTRHEFSRSSADLDYLAGRILLARAAAAQ